MLSDEKLRKIRSMELNESYPMRWTEHVWQMENSNGKMKREKKENWERGVKIMNWLKHLPALRDNFLG